MAFLPPEEPVFDVSKLDEEELGHMEYITQSPSWTRVFRPFFIKAKSTYTALLLNANPEVRARYGGDEYLRCGANNVDTILSFFDKIIEETQHERAMKAHESLDREPDYSDVTEF